MNGAWLRPVSVRPLLHIRPPSKLQPVAALRELNQPTNRESTEASNVKERVQVGSWHFDKRDYEMVYPPRNIRLPTKCKAPAMIAVVEMINEASAAIEPWQLERGQSR